MSSNGGRSGKAWQTATASLYARERLKPPAERTCKLDGPTCRKHGRIVDLDRPYRDPRTGKVDPRSKSANHIVPIAEGGAMYDPANLELAHLGCQHHQGGKIRDKQDRKRRRNRTPSRRSRDW